MKAARSVPSKVADPRKLAADAVRRWHDSIIAGPEGHYDGHIYQVTLDQAFEEVTDALIAEDSQDGAEDREARDLRRLDCARAAGYLIGVQVGLRLRGASNA